MSTDTMDPRCEGLHGDRQCQVFRNKQMFVATYPTPSGKALDVDIALKDFVNEHGTLDSMTMDGVKLQTA